MDSVKKGCYVCARVSRQVSGAGHQFRKSDLYMSPRRDGLSWKLEVFWGRAITNSPRKMVSFMLIGENGQYHTHFVNIHGCNMKHETRNVKRFS